MNCIFHPDQPICAACAAQRRKVNASRVELTFERAQAIVEACIAHVWYREGISDERPPSLAEYSLRELLDANEMLAGHETRGGDRRHISVHCDPRLVAALYVAYHYPPEDPHDCTPVAYGPESAVVIVRAPL